MEGARGRFIVLDGIDGCGKTTQARRLVEALQGSGGRPVVHLREPGSTALGEGIRELVLRRRSTGPDGHPGEDVGPEVETLLFAAARRQMLDERVAPALARGDHVVCERFHPSTFAYQAVAGALDEDRVLELLEGWAGTPRPDVVLLLELSVERAAERRGASTDRIEDKGAAFQRRVAAGYARYRARVPGVEMVDADGTEQEVFVRILEQVRRVL